MRIDLPESELAKRYGAGEGTYELARVYGVSQRTIWNHLQAAGVPTRPRSGQLGNKSRLGQHKPGGPLYSNNYDYLVTRDRENGQCLVHRACWQACRGPIPDGHVVHHQNGDRTDNRIKNLSCLTSGEHTRLHAEARRRAILEEAGKEE